MQWFQLICLEKKRIENYNETIFPEGFESFHPRYAISKRNEWMIKKADIVATYVTRSIGGASKFKSLAEKKNKKVINIAEI